MRWWLLSFLITTAILGTEVYNCKWDYGKYSCELISDSNEKTDVALELTESSGVTVITPTIACGSEDLVTEQAFSIFNVCD